MAERSETGLMAETMREQARALAREHQARAEREIRRLLGLWVSELEPSVAWDEQYRVIGLSYGGRIALPSPPTPG